jgi:hypothetical protein
LHPTTELTRGGNEITALLFLSHDIYTPSSFTECEMTVIPIYHITLKLFGLPFFDLEPK